MSDSAGPPSTVSPVSSEAAGETQPAEAGTGQERFSLINLVFPANIARIINAFLSNRCVWCDEGRGVLVKLNGEYDWICWDCYRQVTEE